MKTTILGLLIIGLAAYMLVPGTDTKPSWGLMGIGLGMIIGRISGSFSNHN